MPSTSPNGRYDTGTNTFRPAKTAANPLPLRKERNQLPGGFSRPDKAAQARPTKLPQAGNKLKGAAGKTPGNKPVTNVQPMLPPE